MVKKRCMRAGIGRMLNVLSYDFIDGKLIVVKKKSPVSLHFALIEENKDTVVLP